MLFYKKKIFSKPTAGETFLNATVVTAIILFIIWLIGFALFIQAVTQDNTPNLEQHTETAIVLTGGSSRVPAGLNLLASGATDRVLISGVYPTTTQDDLLQPWKQKGIDLSCCVTLGHDAINTAGNAAEAKTWLENGRYTSTRLVTATYHMPRALMEFQAVMPSLTIVPHPVTPENFEMTDYKFWSTLAGEYNKYLATHFKFLFM